MSKAPSSKEDVSRARYIASAASSDSCVVVDEFEEAIEALRLARKLKRAARHSAMSANKIGAAASRIRNAGKEIQSPLLVGVAEALEDWLIGWARPTQQQQQGKRAKRLSA